MALTKCPECKKEVSPKAPTCPHCGHPLRTSNAARATSFKITGALCMMIGIVVTIAGPGWGFGLLAVGFVLFVIGRAFQ